MISLLKDWWLLLFSDLAVKSVLCLQTELRIWSVFNIVLFVVPAFKLQITCLVLVVLLSFKCVFWLFYGETSATKWRGDRGYIKATKLFISQNFDRSRKQKTWSKNKIIFPFLVECASVRVILDSIGNKWESGELYIEFWNTFSLKKNYIDPLEQKFFIKKSL